MEAQQSDPSKYDLASVVMINLDTKGESEQPILNFLEILLSNTKEPAEKKQALLAGYGIEITVEKIAQYLGYAVDTIKRWVGLMPTYAAREE